VLIRILTNYFQVISLVQGFELMWPKLIEKGLNYFVRYTNTQDYFFSLDCIYYQTGFNPTKSYYIEVIMIGFFPLVVALISVPFWVLYNYLAIKMKEKKKGGSGETPIFERPDIVGSGSSFFQRDLLKSQSEIP
jgi:hypothetical protein